MLWDLGSKPSVTELAAALVDRSKSGELTAAGVRAIGRLTSVVPSGAGACSPWTATSTWLYNRAEPFMHVYPGRYAPAKVSQSNGVDHSLGVAVQGPSGWYGGHTGGTITISYNALAQSRNLTANSTAFDAVNYRDFTNLCSYQRRPVSVYALLQRIDPAAEPNFTACADVFAGFGYGKTKGVNKTFGSEVNVGPVSVDAQSGWNTQSTVYWTVNYKSQLCGSTAQGWVSAPEAEANSYST